MPAERVSERSVVTLTCSRPPCLRLSRIKYKEEARKLLFKYAEAAKKMIDSRWVTAGPADVMAGGRALNFDFCSVQERESREQEGGEVERRRHHELAA